MSNEIDYFPINRAIPLDVFAQKKQNKQKKHAKKRKQICCKVKIAKK